MLEVGKITSANGENKVMFDTVTTTDAEESEISKKMVRTRGGPPVSDDRTLKQSQEKPW